MNTFEHDKDCLTGVLCTDTPASVFYCTVFFTGVKLTSDRQYLNTYKKEKY